MCLQEELYGPKNYRKQHVTWFFCLHVEFVFMLMSFTWLSNDLLKDDPPSKFQLSIIACSVQSTKTLENPRNLGIVRACADKSLLCFFSVAPSCYCYYITIIIITYIGLKRLWEIFCLWLWVTRNQFSRNQFLPSINAGLSEISGLFALKTNQKLIIFVWIFTCVYSRHPITRTFEGKSKKVRVIGSSKKIAESKVKNSFYCTVNILITFNCRNVKWKLKDTSRL